MTKISKLLLALLLVLVTLWATACSGDGTIKPPSDVIGDSGTGESTPTQGSSTDPEVTVAEAVVFEAEGIKVTVKGLEEGFLGSELRLLVENDSARNMLLTADSVSANGYMMPGASLYAEVAAGKKANESLTLMSSELEQSGIEILSELQFYLTLQDPETWDTVQTSDLLTVTTSAQGHVQDVDDSGDVVYEDKGYKVVCKGLKKDIIWDGTVVFYMENNTGREVSIYAENVSVNGFMQDVGMWSDLRPNTRMIDGMSMLDLSDLELESTDEIKSIEFNLRIVDADTWDELVTTDAITLSFE